MTGAVVDLWAGIEDWITEYQSTGLLPSWATTSRKRAEERRAALEAARAENARGVEQAAADEGDKGLEGARPLVSLSDTGARIVFHCPMRGGYERAYQSLGGLLSGGRDYSAPFSRVFDLGAANERLEESGLAPFAMDDELKEVVTRPIPGYDGTVDSLKEVPLSELWLVEHGVLSAKMRGASHDSIRERLLKMGLATFYDLLHYMPLRFVDKSNPVHVNELFAGEKATVVGTVSSVYEGTTKNSLKYTKFTVVDETGRSVPVYFWRQPWLARQYGIGDSVLVTGAVKPFMREVSLSGESIESTENASGLPVVPVYRQSAKNGINSQFLVNLVRELLGRIEGVREPEYAREGVAGRMGLHEAWTCLHLPPSRDAVDEAWERLAYDELVLLQVLLRRFRAPVDVPGVPSTSRRGLNELVASLPFTMTDSQLKAAQRLVELLEGDRANVSLLVGDVGTGKSLTAAFPIIASAVSGHQVAVLAPTTILARQMHDSITRAVEGSGTGLRVELLDQGWSAKGPERRAFLSDLKGGSIDVAVGTTGLLQKSVVFKDLGLVVVDEQQKFGVGQRSSLLRSRGDGAQPDVLMMTATPIPRSSAQAIYGDVEVLRLTDKPEGRLPIITKWIDEPPKTYFSENIVNELVDHIHREAAAGHQSFIVAPFIESSTGRTADVASVKAVHKELSSGLLGGLRVAVLHGKMKKPEQDRIMMEFRNGDYDVLVASAVIEVGIDVPNATIIAILSADRLGTASLHQMRGRVGRSGLQSYCYLVADSSGMTPRAARRLQALVDSDDGAALAFNDMASRGEGTVMGTRQKGRASTSFANVLSHAAMLEDAFADAGRILGRPDADEAVEDAIELYGEYDGTLI